MEGPARLSGRGHRLLKCPGEVDRELVIKHALRTIIEAQPLVIGWHCSREVQDLGQTALLATTLPNTCRQL